MKSLYIFFCFCAICFSELQAHEGSNYDPKEKAKVAALNDCISFTNESIHGMLIAKGLFENFNQKLNKYVDLEGQPLNFYSNSDLPNNIFEDPEDWFYETSPLEWYAQCIKSTEALGSGAAPIRANLNEIKNLFNEVNQLRFTLENLMKALENDDKALPIVYEKLETVAKLYNQFFVLRNHIEETVYTEYEKLKLYHEDESFYKYYEAFIPLHRHYLTGARHYRFEEQSSLAKINVNIDDDLRKMPKAENLRYNHSSNPSISDPKQIMQRIYSKAEKYISNTNEFLSSPDIEEKYAQYGKYYYYHNIKILSQFNRYGNGLVSDFNSLIDMTGAPYLKFLEEPHIFKVIYPEKLDDNNIENVEVTIASALPDVLENRTIVKRKDAISAEDDYMVIEIYDHQKLDRDIVSINFNGQWILQDFTISDKPKKMRLKLNRDGVNYLILHAENVGVIPPNTMALKYTIGGVKKEIILNSDLEESEMIEISL